MSQSISFHPTTINGLTFELEEFQLLSKTGGYKINLITGELYPSKGYMAIHEIDQPYHSSEEFYNTVHPEDRNGIEQKMRAVIDDFFSRNESILPFEVTYRIIARKTKRILTIRDIVTPFYGENGLAGLLGVIQDVTEDFLTRQKLELSMSNLQQTKAELEEALNFAGLGAWEVDFVNKKTKWHHSEFKRYEIQAEPQSFEEYLMYVHPDDRHLLLETDSRVWKGQRESEKIRFRIITGSGKIRYNYTTLTPVYEDGKLTKLKGITQDITPIVQREAELENAKAYLEESQLLADIGSWEYDVVNDKQHWSLGQFRIYDLDEKDAPKNFNEFLSFIHPDDRHIFENTLPKMMQGKLDSRSLNFNFRIITKAGKIKYITSRLRTIYENDRLAFIRGVNQDITEAVLRENELKLINRDLEESQWMAGVGTWRLNLVTGEINWSKELRHLIEFPLDAEPSVESFFSTIHPADLENSKGIFESFKAKFEEDPYSKIVSQNRIITRVTRQIKHISFTNTAVINNGKVVGYRGVLKDVTYEVEQKKALEKSYDLLAQSEMRFSNVFNYSGMSMAIVSIEGYFENVNRNLEKLTGYSADELSKIRLADVTHHNDWREEQEKTGKLLAKLIPAFEYEKRITTKTHDVKWVVQTTSCIFNDFNRPLYLVVQIRDITEKILAEKKIFEQQQRFISAFHKSSVGMSLRNLRGDFEEVNDAFCHFLGYTRNELLNLNARDVTHPESWKEELTLIQKVKNEESTGYTIQKQYIHKTGKPIFGLLTVNMIKSAEGALINMIAQVQDITAQIESHRIVQSAKEKFEHIFYKSGIGMTLADASGKFNEVNESLCEMLGYSRQELIGETFAKITHPEDLNISLDVNKKLNTGTNQVTFEKRYVRKDGQVINVLVSIGIISDPTSGEKIIISQIQNITDLIENKKIIQLAKEKFEHVFKFSGVGMFIVGDNGKMQEVNGALCEMTGYTERELFNLSALDITHPDDLAENKDLRSRLLRGEINRFTKEKRYIRKDGSIMYGLLTASLINGIGNDRRFVLGQIQDITELKTQINLRLENERKFRALVENSLVGIVVIENDKVIYANPTLIKMFGYDEFEEFASKSMVEMALPETRELIEKRNNLAKTGHPASPLAHGQFFTKQGKVITIESHTTFIIVGNKILKSSVIVDVTEKSLAQKKLEETNSVFQLAQKFANLGSWRWTIESGALYWSDSIYKIFGYNKKKDIVSYNNFLKSVHPEDRSKVESTIKHSLERQIPYEVEHRILLRNGKTKWLVEKGNVIKDNDGKPIEMYGIVRDITDAKLTAEELRQSKEQYQLLAESGQELICLNTPDGYFIYASPSMKLLLGYNPKKIPGSLRTIDLVHPDDKEAFLLLQENVLKHKKKIFSGRFRFLHKNGNYVWCEKNVKAVVNAQNEVVSVRSLTRSIDQQVEFENQLTETNRQLGKAMKALEEASEAKENFLSIMSHEIRTPLNSVIGLSNLLIRRNPREDQAEVIKTLKSSADNLMHLVNDILDFNKIRSGKVQLEIMPFSIIEFFEQQHASYKIAAYDKGLEFTIKIDPRIPEFLEGDVTRLNQVFTNLLTNAIKFTHTGFVKLTADLNYIRNERCSISFKVEDTGVGIAAEKHDLVFEPFHQSEANITRQYGGTGLGLSIVKSLVELMQGKISMGSIPNAGSVFTIKMEFAVSKQSQAKKQSISVPLIKTVLPPSKRYKVLYVEDVESNRFLIENLLMDHHLACHVASSGKAALRQTMIKKFDVILMDIQMPGMDGYKVTDLLRKQKGGKNRKTPVIAFTAEPYSATLKNKTLAHQIQYVISKPFDPNNLIEKIIWYAASNRLNKKMFSFSFYEELFNHDPVKLDKIKKAVISDLSRFGEKLKLKNQRKNIKGIREEVHKIRPIAKNLAASELVALLEKFSQCESYSPEVNKLCLDTIKHIKIVLVDVMKLNYQTKK